MTNMSYYMDIMLSRDASNMPLLTFLPSAGLLNSMICLDVTRHDITLHDMPWHDMAWHDMKTVWHGMARWNVTWCNVAWDSWKHAKTSCLVAPKTSSRMTSGKGWTSSRTPSTTLKLAFMSTPGAYPIIAYHTKAVIVVGSWLIFDWLVDPFGHWLKYLVIYWLLGLVSDCLISLVIDWLVKWFLLLIDWLVD